MKPGPFPVELFRQNFEAQREAFETFKKSARPFEPIARPKGYRKKKDKECFYNAAMFAIDKRGRYVEGYGQSVGGLMVHHAWITLDGVHAIEVTWREPGDIYWGIEVDTVTVAKSWRDGFATPQFGLLPGILRAEPT